jgi:ketosteroid isomerase-like protein
VHDPEFEAAIHAAFESFNERRFDVFATYMAEDVVEIYPQSGERITGRTRQQAYHEAFPNPPTFEVRNIVHSGDLAVAEVEERSADGSVWHDVFIFEMRDSAVQVMTVYFGQPFDAPEWRRAFHS